MSSMETLKAAVSALDASLPNLVSENTDERREAILDAAKLLTAAKAVVLEA